MAQKMFGRFAVIGWLALAGAITGTGIVMHVLEQGPQELAVLEPLEILVPKR